MKLLKQIISIIICFIGLNLVYTPQLHAQTGCVVPPVPAVSEISNIADCDKYLNSIDSSYYSPTSSCYYVYINAQNRRESCQLKFLTASVTPPAQTQTTTPNPMPQITKNPTIKPRQVISKTTHTPTSTPTNIPTLTPKEMFKFNIFSKYINEKNLLSLSLITILILLGYIVGLRKKYNK